MPLVQWTLQQCDEYVKLLKIIWWLSNLFSESTIPYLYYRAAENIFCKAFSADNLSRSDCTADASLHWIWYWLKTFICNWDKSLEKIAEFDRDRNSYDQFSSDLKMYVEEISKLRNERITVTKNIYDINEMYYHCVTRTTWKFSLHEEAMDYINIDNIKNIKKKDNTITFNDWLHEYSFSTSKSTLYKRFYIRPIISFDVDILDDPLSALQELYARTDSILSSNNVDSSIILPLFIVKNWLYQVPEKSWLNQWNAGWRTRDPNEIYISVPSKIRGAFPNFFPWRETSFNLHLPNWSILSAKICQDWWKALQSNPNKALWEWLLRHVLQKQEWELVTYQDLQNIWVDSVEVSKRGVEYYINFKSLWSYERFCERNLIS